MSELEPGMRVLVYGIGRAQTAGDPGYFIGDLVEAELVQQIGGGAWWFVEFAGDLDGRGEQIKRVRMIY